MANTPGENFWLYLSGLTQNGGDGSGARTAAAPFEYLGPLDYFGLADEPDILIRFDAGWHKGPGDAAIEQVDVAAEAEGVGAAAVAASAALAIDDVLTPETAAPAETVAAEDATDGSATDGQAADVGEDSSTIFKVVELDVPADAGEPRGEMLSYPVYANLPEAITIPDIAI